MGCFQFITSSRRGDYETATFATDYSSVVDAVELRNFKFYRTQTRFARPILPRDSPRLNFLKIIDVDDWTLYDER